MERQKRRLNLPALSGGRSTLYIQLMSSLIVSNRGGIFLLRSPGALMRVCLLCRARRGIFPPFAAYGRQTNQRQVVLQAALIASSTSASRAVAGYLSQT
jgi:hypothetical protein